MNVEYTQTAKGLHWLMAVVIIGLLALGIYMSNLPLSPIKLELYAWHKWFGVTVFLLVWIRLAWRIMHPPPAPPEGLSTLLVRLAHIGHFALYAFMIVIPLSGWLMSSAKGFQTVWFGVVPLPDLIDKNRELGDALQLLHKVLNVLFMLTIAGHAAAALWHHVWRKDETLRRMGWRFSK